MRPGREDGSAGPNKWMGLRRRKRFLRSLVTHSPQRGGLYMAPGTTKRCKTAMALSYRPTYDNLVKKLCSGPLLNVDETGISVRGHGGFVWVLASAEDVAYVYTPTREGTTIQGLLKDFTGVLVSDFYTAYDSIPCIQQKCLIHFIRDL